MTPKYIQTSNKQAADLLVSKGFKLVSKQEPSLSIYTFAYEEHLIGCFSRGDLNFLKGMVTFTNTFTAYF